MFHVCFNFPNSWRIWLPIGKLSILIREGKILFEIVVQGDWQSCSCYETMKNLFFSSEEITSLVCNLSLQLQRLGKEFYGNETQLLSFRLMPICFYDQVDTQLSWSFYLLTFSISVASHQGSENLATKPNWKRALMERSKSLGSYCSFWLFFGNSW